MSTGMHGDISVGRYKFWTWDGYAWFVVWDRSKFLSIVSLKNTVRQMDVQQLKHTHLQAHLTLAHLDLDKRLDNMSWTGFASNQTASKSRTPVHMIILEQQKRGEIIKCDLSTMPLPSESDPIQNTTNLLVTSLPAPRLLLLYARPLLLLSDVHAPSVSLRRDLAAMATPQLPSSSTHDVRSFWGSTAPKDAMEIGRN